jgi:ABC-2 type transport system permease protein
MNAAAATALRVLTQLRRDPRTLALLLVVPCALVTLLKYVFVDRPFVFDRIGGTAPRALPFHCDVLGRVNHDAPGTHDGDS